MRSAARMIDITPPVGLGICGNVRDDNIARNTHDSLLCNAVLMDAQDSRVLFLAMDWVGIREEEATLLREKVGKALDISKDNVIVSATHTHSGPSTIIMSQLEKHTPEEKKYIGWAIDKIVDEAAKLCDELEEVSLWRADCEVEGLSFNRRLRMADGKVIMNWVEVDPTDVVNTTGPIDKEMSIIITKRNDGTLQSLMINFTLHAAIIAGRDWLWSADYVYYLRKAIWETYKEKPVVYFTNGAEGDINSVDYKNYNLEGFSEAQRYGYALADYTKKALGSAVRMPSKLKCVSGAVALYKREISQEWTNWAKTKWEKCGGVIPQLLHGIPSEFYARDILYMAEFGGQKDIYPMTAVLVGDVAGVTLPGEVFCQIGLNIKAKSPFLHTMMIGLAQGYCGYITDKKAFLEGGYEPRTGAVSMYEKDSCDKIESVAGNLLELL